MRTSHEVPLVDAVEGPPLWIPVVGGHRFECPAHHRHHDVRHARVVRLTITQGLPTVRLRKIRPVVGMRVIDHSDAEAVVFETTERQDVPRIHVVGDASRTRKGTRILFVLGVLDVSARDQPPLLATEHDDSTALVRVFGGGLARDDVQFVWGQDHRSPPASAGMIVTSSPSLSGVFRPWSASIPSLLTKMFT